jgi:hypothetical protein
MELLPLALPNNTNSGKQIDSNVNGLTSCFLLDINDFMVAPDNILFS